MPFDKVDTQVDFPALERQVLDFWKKTGAFEKLRQKNRGKPRWSFLDGPITANNPMGVHHAWGRTYKDAFQRYFAMTGHEQRYQNGFDCQGLWVEVEVEKELKLRSKRDIENLVPGDRFASIDKFVNECKARVNKFAKRQTEQSIRLGFWMDWDREEDWAKPPDERRSYFTMSEENNCTIWSFLKKCHQRGPVYRAYDSMPWCSRCGVGISQMEMHEGYVLMAHRAVFLRFPLRGRPGESLLIWTTTPWTLTSNVGAAVNPELTYLKVKHKDHVYYLAKGVFTHQRLEEEFKRKEWVDGVPKLKTLEQLFKEKGGYEVVGEVSGKEMVGWEYDGPFDELPAQQHPGGYPDELAQVVLKQKWGPNKPARQCHRVVAWKDVGEREGTGIVHTAPGCGKEDFQLGKEEGLVPIAPLDETGNFLPGFGELEGKFAVDPAVVDWLLDNLQKKGLLFAVEKYPHNYPHCWRCKTELLFRLVDEWFIDMKWRDEIMRVTEQVTFLPESINGKARELDWLKNMGDWMISKKRFWGLALPVWVCDKCNAFDVIGSRDELKRRAVEGWDRFEGHSPHRPWIDLVKVRCEKCGGTASRVPDVGNPWLDAGIVPYSTMGYNRDRKSWEKWFPADFITECFPGQFRNWFYAILAMSTMMENRPPFKVLLGHGLVRDEHGAEMHKSAGNAIPFEGAANEGYTIAHRHLKPNEKPEEALRKEKLPDDCLGLKLGEVVREGKTVPAILADYPPMGSDVMRWLYCRNNPAANINFGPHPAAEVRREFLLKLWYSYGYLCNYARPDGFNPSAAPVPFAERPDLDRWLLSSLQRLVETAHKAFREFNVQSLCQAADKFVNDELSNWYIRRTRRRFWSKNEELTPAQARDKLAAYQTLYATLMTLTKLLAPIIPFLTEKMYQNLRTAADPESVHLCDYPQVDESMRDEQLAKDMDELFELVRLGSAARNQVKLKVRQPLAELKVQPGSDAARCALTRFSTLLCEELNLKRVTVHDATNGPLLKTEVKPNPKALGSKGLGPRLKEVTAALARLDPEEVARKANAGETVELPLADGPVALEKADLWVTVKALEGWAGAADRGTQVLLDARLTEELANEGMARDVIRQVQELRKKADLDLSDKIALRLETSSPKLTKAIQAFRDFIAAEAQVVEWPASIDGDVHCEEVKVEGQPLVIELGKV